MEMPHMATRHRFLMGESVRVAIEGKMYKGTVIGIHAADIEVSEINPYGITADQINVIHSDSFTVIFYEKQPAQSNLGENVQGQGVPNEIDNAQFTTQSNHGALVRYATDQFGDAIQHLLDGTTMPRPSLAEVSNPDCPITPYTMILHGMMPGEINTYFNNAYQIALFGISPNSISTSVDKFYALVPFGTEPHPGAYYLLPRSDLIPSYLVDIRYRFERFDSQDEQATPISRFRWVDDTSLGFTVLFEDKLKKDDPHPEEGSVSLVNEQGSSMPPYQELNLRTHDDF